MENSLSVALRLCAIQNGAALGPKALHHDAWLRRGRGLAQSNFYLGRLCAGRPATRAQERLIGAPAPLHLESHGGTKTRRVTY